MSDTKSPAFQFYPKDFLTDWKQIRMSVGESGAYWRLCCHCWLQGSLPSDLKALARLAGTSPRQMRDMWPAIGPCFTAHADGQLTHPRLEREREKQRSNRQRQSDRATARWEMERKLAEKRGKGHAVASARHTSGIHPAVPDRCSPSPSPTTVTVSTEQKPEAPAEKAPSRVREFLTWFQGEYKAQRNGATYFVKWEAHGAIVKRLLAAFAFERLQKLAKILLRSNEEWIESTDRGIEILSAKVNWLEERLCAWEVKQKAREAV